ncbi:MAG: MFS transporter [Planctomycetota bacterium]
MSTETHEPQTPADSRRASGGSAGLAGGLPWYGPLAGFDPARVPSMSRPNYRRELLAALFIPCMVVLFEGSVLSIIVRIAYEGRVETALLNQVSSFIAVIPALANLSSFIWVRATHGRHKVRSITRLLVMVAVVTMTMAFVPSNAVGLIWTAAAAFIARVGWSGFTTIRSTIWRTNYPQHARARITGRFAMVATLMLAALSAAIGTLLGWTDAIAQSGAMPGWLSWVPVDPADLPKWTMRTIIPLGCTIGVIGMIIWRTIRVRGHSALVNAERRTSGPESPTLNPADQIRVLFKDPDYGRYMLAQFLLGIGNIMSVSVMPLILRERFGTGYFEGLLISTVIPLGLMPFAIPMWARLLDGRHIVFFRAVHSWVFVIALALLFFAYSEITLWVMFVFAAVRGIAFGGGALGWTLGHLDFAKPEQATQYMGVHVTLTGVRGLICVTTGATLYNHLESTGAGNAKWLLLACLIVTTLGGLGFVHLWRDLVARGKINPNGERLESE